MSDAKLDRILAWGLTLAVLVATACALAGCTAPTVMSGAWTPDGKVTLQTEQVGTFVPGTGTAIITSQVDTTQASHSWLAVIAAGLAVVGGLNVAGPKGWSNIANIFGNWGAGSTWGGTGQSVLALAGIAHTPPEAKAFTPALTALTGGAPGASA